MYPVKSSDVNRGASSSASRIFTVTVTVVLKLTSPKSYATTLKWYTERFSESMGGIVVITPDIEPMVKWSKAPSSIVNLTAELLVFGLSESVATSCMTTIVLTSCSVIVVL